MMILVAAVLTLIWGCTDYEGTTDPVNKDGNIYLFNGLGDIGTLSVIEDEGEISNDVLSVGKWPNHIMESGGILYVVNSGNNNVQMINSENNENIGSVELQQFSNPMRVAIASRKLYATNTFGSGVSVYSFDNDSLYTISITGVPDSCRNGGTDAVLAYGNKIYIGVKNVTYDEFWNAIYGEEYIIVIDASADTLVTSFKAGMNIADMMVDNENELHVLCTGNRNDVQGSVKIFNLNNYENISQISLGSQPGSFAMNGEGIIYVAVSGLNPDWTGFGGIMKYNSATNEVLNGSTDQLYTSTGSGIMDICVDGYGKVYAPLFNKNELVILENDEVDTVLTTGNGPQGLVFVEKEE